MLAVSDALLQELPPGPEDFFRSDSLVLQVHSTLSVRVRLPSQALDQLYDRSALDSRVFRWIRGRTSLGTRAGLLPSRCCLASDLTPFPRDHSSVDYTQICMMDNTSFRTSRPQPVQCRTQTYGTSQEADKLLHHTYIHMACSVLVLSETKSVSRSSV